MFNYKPVVILVLSVNCAFGVNHQRSDESKCCVGEEDSVASATYLFPNHGAPYHSDPSYYAYDTSHEGPLILETNPASYEDLAFHHYPLVQPAPDNVQVITKYSNEQKSGPVYKSSTVTRTNTDPPIRQTIIKKPDRLYSQTNPYIIDTGRPTHRKEEYSLDSSEQPEKKSVFKETKSEGGESSSFNRGVHFKKSYNEPHTSSKDSVVSTIQPLITSTIGPPSIVITPKSIKTSLFSTVEPSKIDVTPKSLESSKLIRSTVGPTSSESQSTLSDRLSDVPLHEAGSISKSYVGDFDSPSDHFFGGGGYGGYGYDAGKAFEKEKGEHYAEGHKKGEAHKSDSEYEHKEKFKKGEEQKHGSHHHKGSAHEHGGEKKGHIDEGKKFSTGHESSNGALSNDFHHKKGHRKGHKKSGFHTVHHKDEFKKDEHFFDEEHDTGDESAIGHSSHDHHKKHGGEKKEGHHDSGYHEKQHKKEGGKEDAASHAHHAGHKAEEGHKSHHAEKADHASKEGHKEVEKHGHAEKEGHVL